VCRRYLQVGGPQCFCIFLQSKSDVSSWLLLPLP
jgi:hypothetical protein